MNNNAASKGPIEQESQKRTRQHLSCNLYSQTEELDNLTLRLCDFGLSKRVEEGCEMRTFCGSAQTMSPEIIASRHLQGGIDTIIRDGEMLLLIMHSKLLIQK